MGAACCKEAAVAVSTSDVTLLRRGRVHLKRYSEPDSIWEALLAGHVRLVSASWLVKHSGASGILMRRQDLPEEAFISVDELKRCYGEGNRDKALPVISISL